MTIIPRAVVPAPEPRGLRYGLLTAAVGPLDLPAPHGRGGGLTYEPVSLGSGRRYPVECPAGETPTAKVFDPNDSWIDADPYIAYASLNCGAAGHTPAELEAKVARRLANAEQLLAEQAMNDLLVAKAGPTVPANDPLDLASVVGSLEQWLYGPTGSYGNVGYLHAPATMAAHAQEDGLIVRDGPLMRTALGTVWVFGGGYTDNGAIHISGHTTVWRSPDVFVYPAEQVFNRVTNQYNLLAEREYAVAVEGPTAKATFTGAS